MPPRKPKQPTRRKAVPKKAEPKKATEPDFNPETHLLGDDGQLYERKTITATGVAVGVNTPHTPAHLDLEGKITHAIHQAHTDGITHPEEIKKRILAAREAHLGNDS